MAKPKFKRRYIENCLRPFEEFEVHSGGNVYTCCPAWNHGYSLGNIFEQSFEEIWNGKKAVDLRERILKQDYSLCDAKNCHTMIHKDFLRKYDYVMCPVMKQHPRRINLCYDYECNAACIFCREKVTTLSDEELELFNSKIDDFFMPLLKGAYVLELDGSGEALASRHSRLLLKKAIERYPNLKFSILTNGVLCSEEMFKELKLTARKIEEINISLHSATKETYGKIFRNFENKFDTVIKNIAFLSSINHFDFFLGLNFVVVPQNFRDLPGFIEIAEKYDAVPFIWEYRPGQNSTPNANHADLTITDKNHPEFKEFVKVLQNPKLDKYVSRLSPILVQIREERF